VSEESTGSSHAGAFEKVRRHHHRHESRSQRFWRQYRFEIVWVVVVALGIFLVMEKLSLRHTLLLWGRQALAWLGDAAGRSDSGVVGAIRHATPADIAGSILILGALVILFVRLRRQLTQAPLLRAGICPRCGGGLHRVHRHAWDRVVSWYVPVRRYRCANPTCRWENLRVEPAGQSARDMGLVIAKSSLLALALGVVLLVIAGLVSASL
jgi:hypothetical protein